MKMYVFTEDDMLQYVWSLCLDRDDLHRFLQTMADMGISMTELVCYNLSNYISSYCSANSEELGVEEDESEYLFPGLETQKVYEVYRRLYESMGVKEFVVHFVSEEMRMRHHSFEEQIEEYRPIGYDEFEFVLVSRVLEEKTANAIEVAGLVKTVLSGVLTQVEEVYCGGAFLEKVKVFSFFESKKRLLVFAL